MATFLSRVLEDSFGPIVSKNNFWSRFRLKLAVYEVYVNQSALVHNVWGSGQNIFAPCSLFF